MLFFIYPFFLHLSPFSIFFLIFGLIACRLGLSDTSYIEVRKKQQIIIIIHTVIRAQSERIETSGLEGCQLAFRKTMISVHLIL